MRPGGGLVGRSRPVGGGLVGCSRPVGGGLVGCSRLVGGPQSQPTVSGLTLCSQMIRGYSDAKSISWTFSWKPTSGANVKPPRSAACSVSTSVKRSGSHLFHGASTPVLPGQPNLSRGQ